MTKKKKIYITMPVAFISHQLFSKDNIIDNKISMYKLAEEVSTYGYSPLVVADMFPWLIKDNQETDRELAIIYCKSLINISNLIVFDHNKVSDGVIEEIIYACKIGKPVVTIDYLRKVGTKI